ncbi:hypothetical protein ACIPR8_18535 [Stenotrophomonas sp. LARHCG68]
MGIVIVPGLGGSAGAFEERVASLLDLDQRKRLLSFAFFIDATAEWVDYYIYTSSDGGGSLFEQERVKLAVEQWVEAGRPNSFTADV